MRAIKHAVPILLATFALFLQTSRADVSVGVQDYIVLGRESQVRTVMNQYYDLADGTWSNSSTAAEPSVTSRVALTASADDQYFIYDHWEDGFETMPTNPVDFIPAQTSTLIFHMARGQTVTLDSSDPNSSTQCIPGSFQGSGDCDFNGVPSPTGQVANLSDTPATTACTYTCPLVALPRLSADIRFDGGDAIRSFGGPATVVHQDFPVRTNGTNAQAFLGAALEHFSLQSMAGFLSYRIPVGQSADATPVSANMSNNPFYFARGMITAFADDTQVTVNNGTTQVTVTLNRGQSYSTSGHDNAGATIDEAAAPNIRLVAGTRVDSSKEVAVSIVNGGMMAWEGSGNTP